jgi:NAD(P)-dependent dehydrogenase (short-subunit alcohol dehydrogenase family)
MRRPTQTTVQLAGLAAGVALAGAWWLSHRAPHSFRAASVLITGGARGLGLVLARRFAAEGARVYLASRSRDELLRAERELRAAGGDVRSLVCDVRDAAAVSRTISRIVGETGRIDVVVNNAGIIQTTPIEHAQVEDFVDSLNTHFWGPFNVVRSALPWMRRQGAGRIVNITSIGGRVAVPHLLPYAVGKFALVGFSQGLQAELRKDGILVTTVVPGLMRTGSHQRVQVRGQHEKEVQWFGLGVATPLTSMQVDRAAAQIIAAARAGRAHVTLTWQARLLEIAQGVAPELTSALLTAVASHVLPGPSPRAAGDRLREFSQVEKGWVEPFLPDAASVRNNEIPPPV